MNKKITTGAGAERRRGGPRAGLEVGAFFILCYPGETDDTVLDTLRFATSLPLDYLGLTMPYPLPGHGPPRAGRRRGSRARGGRRAACSLNHVLTFEADFSATKMRFAIAQGPRAVRDEAAAGALGARWPCGSSRGRPTRCSGCCR